MKIRRWIIALCTVVMAVGFTSGAALGDPPKVKGNCGGGNGSEIVNGADVDPGNGNQPPEHCNGKD
jgi:hypothetical protein